MANRSIEATTISDGSEVDEIEQTRQRLAGVQLAVAHRVAQGVGHHDASRTRS